MKSKALKKLLLSFVLILFAIILILASMAGTRHYIRTYIRPIEIPEWTYTLTDLINYSGNAIFINNKAEDVLAIILSDAILTKIDIKNTQNIVTAGGGVLINIMVIYASPDNPSDYKALQKKIETNTDLSKLILKGSINGPDLCSDKSTRIGLVDADLAGSDNYFLGQNNKYNVTTSGGGKNCLVGGAYDDSLITGSGMDVLRGKGGLDFLEPGNNPHNLVIEDT